MEFRQVRGKMFLQAEGGNYIQVLKYYQGVNKIGRNPLITDITIKQNSISQIHAELLCQANILRIIDLNSKNGVFVNSVKIGSQKYVYINPYNDTLYFGSVKCKFFPSFFSTQMEEQTVKGQVDCRKRKIKKKQKMNELLDFGEEKKGKNLQIGIESKGRNKVRRNKYQNERQLKNQNNCIKEEFSNKFEHFIVENHELDYIKDQMSQQTKANSNQKSLETPSMEVLNLDIISMNNQKGDILELQNKNSGCMDINGGQQNMRRNIPRVSKRPNKKSCQKRLPGVLIHQNQKEDKKSQSCETKIKLKKSRKTKTIDLMQSKSKSKSKNLRNRKKLPDHIQNEGENQHGKRSIIQKTALLSGFTLAFKPTVKINVTQNWRDIFDVLVMDKYSRTFKLLYSICLGIPVVNRNWIIQSEYRRGIAPTERFLLQSPSNSIQVSLTRARNRKIFDKMKFYLLGNVELFHLPVEQIEVLIEVGGGQLLKDLSLLNDDESVLIIVPLKYEGEVLQKIRSKKHRQKCYSIEMILDSCLNQQIRWQKNKIEIQ